MPLSAIDLGFALVSFLSLALLAIYLLRWRMAGKLSGILTIGQNGYAVVPGWFDMRVFMPAIAAGGAAGFLSTRMGVPLLATGIVAIVSMLLVQWRCLVRLARMVKHHNLPPHLRKIVWDIGIVVYDVTPNTIGRIRVADQNGGSHDFPAMSVSMTNLRRGMAVKKVKLGEGCTYVQPVC